MRILWFRVAHRSMFHCYMPCLAWYSSWDEWPLRSLYTPPVSACTYWVQVRVSSDWEEWVTVRLEWIGVLSDCYSERMHWFHYLLHSSCHISLFWKFRKRKILFLVSVKLDMKFQWNLKCRIWEHAYSLILESIVFGPSWEVRHYFQFLIYYYYLLSWRTHVIPCTTCVDPGAVGCRGCW